MGVPKFYRWISERYPKINQIISDNALLPEFDHLYLDMNGIIHGCTHPPSMDVGDSLTEREMMLGIMHYLDRIITQIVKPKVSVYMAIDGVAPRAKLNQQRSRRFRSARDLAEATKDLPKDEQTQSAVFDSNCITPGTEFLAKVSDHIQYFIRQKMKEDPAWHGLTVIFSGHDIPGEGEHKIMQHIREMKAQPDYQPNQRHCIYGQDADLIMLGLVTHEPHFTILREVVDFNFNFASKNTLKAVKKFTKESDFQLLHLSILREYLQIEFCYQQSDKFNLERVVDDFVFMTFLVGNDFLPHMPTLDIGDGAFDLLFDIYKEQRHGWGATDNYLTHAGEISDPARLELFLAAIGAVETDILEQREKDDAAYVKKRRRWDRRDGNPEGPSDAELKADETARQNDYLSMIESMMTKLSCDDKSQFVDGWKPVTEPGQKDFKGRYYFEKLKMTPIDKDEHWALRRSYMEGLMWCLAYYYKGCISWGWFYPYHYGPMLSDLINIPKMFDEINFELGEPLTPFQQLMGCLPPASSALVPPLYRPLMVCETPIIQFYPTDFQIDMNGKKNPWEGVNLLPFIDVKLLKDTIASLCPESKLSVAERRRNKIGKVYCYKYDVSCTDTVKSPNPKIGLPDIVGSHSSVSIIEEQEEHLDITFEPNLVPGTQLPYPGFPSLNVLPIASVELTRLGLNCFGSPSKYPNMLLTLHQMPELPPIEVLAENVLGKSLFVNWPMMHEARVVAVSDETKEIRLVKNKPKAKEFTKLAADRWMSESEAMMQTYHIGNGVPGSGGVQINEIKVRLKLLPLQGMKANPANGSTKKLFGREEADVPLQLALWQAPAPDPRFVERGPMTLKDRFPEGSSVVLTKGKYRGCTGTAVGVVDKQNVGVKVQVVPAELPFGLAIARSVQESYISSVDASRILKIHPGAFGKITGMLQFQQGKYDLGLNLKSADGTCVIGYTRKKVGGADGKRQKGKDQKPSAWAAGDSLLVVGSSRSAGNDDDENQERIQWEYTPKAIRLVDEYRKKFPQLFSAISKAPNEKRYDANEVFGPNGEAWLPVVREWLNSHESAKLPRSPVTTDSMSYEAVAAVQKAADVRSLALKKRGYPKESLIKIPGSALYREGSTGATDVLLASDLNKNHAPHLGDRVVNLCAAGIPFGARGTVVGIHQAATTGSVEVVMDEEFIGGTTLQGACSNFRGKLCVWSHLLKIEPDNSKGVVDKLVPKGSGPAAFEKILSKAINRQVQNDPAVHIKSSWDSQVDSAEEKEKVDQALAPAAEVAKPTQPRTGPRTPSRSASRAGSSGRGRQGAWKEARGPDEKGIGFKEMKKGGKKNGYSRWKSLVKSKVKQPGADESSAQLKAILGVNPDSMEAVSSATSRSTKAVAADDKLKAMLGVTGTGTSNAPVEASVAPATTPASADAAGLKAMLGVDSAAPDRAQQPVPKKPSAPATAADKLLQLMASQQPVPPTSYPTPGPAGSGFNFSYVQHGKGEAPPPPAPAVFPQMYPMPPVAVPHAAIPPRQMPMPQRPMHPPMPVAGYGMPPPRNLPYQQRPRPPAGSQYSVSGPLDQFPPLGSEKPEEKPVTATGADSLISKEKVAKPADLMIPSVVAAKAKR